MAHPNEPSCSSPDTLTARLLPVVIHQLNNATQLLANFQALLSLGGADELLRSRSSDLAETARSVHELGYVLAVVSSASGADLLQARHEPEGLAWMFHSVRDGLRRDGSDIAEPNEPFPLLSSAVGEGWQLPWAFGSLLYTAGQSAGSDGRVEWSLDQDDEGWTLSASGVRTNDLAELASLIDTRLPESSLTDMDDGLRLVFPASWLSRSEPPSLVREDQG